MENSMAVSQIIKNSNTIVKVKVTQSSPGLCDPMDCTVHGILQARILERVAFPFSSRSSQPRDRTQVSRVAGIFFTIWATKEVQVKWSGSLSLIQGTFLNQGTNWGILHCRWILYQLSYQSQSESRSVVSDSLWPHRPYSSWNSPGQNTGVDSLSLLQQIFPTQGSNPGLPRSE